MAVNYKKFLPSNIRNTRWGDIALALQDLLLNQFKPQKVDVLRNRFILELATQDELKELIYTFGYHLSQGNGYTATIDYIKKQAKTLAQRVKTKSTVLGYPYLFYIFNLVGDVYPLLQGELGYLTPWLDWLTVPETGESAFILDNDLHLDQGMDSILYYAGPGLTNPVYDVPLNDGTLPWTLDNLDIVDIITRHFLISYYYRFAENSSEFMSADTARAFFNDVIQMKRAVEVPHFEQRLRLYASSLNTPTITPYYDESGANIANQESILISSLAVPIVTIQFGRGGYTSPLSTTIPGVQDLIASYPLTDFQIKLQDSTHLYFKNKIQINTKWFDYSELALIDNSGNCLYYSKFPTVRFHPQMLSSIYLFFAVV